MSCSSSSCKLIPDELKCLNATNNENQGRLKKKKLCMCSFERRQQLGTGVRHEP